MNNSPDQPIGTAAGLPADLPGRIIDVVYVAAHRAGITLSSFNLALYGRRPTLTAHLRGGGPRTEQMARAVFAQLGITQTELSTPGPEYNHATVEATVPALNAHLEIVIDKVPADPEPCDPTALIADVDTRRAGQDPQ